MWKWLQSMNVIMFPIKLAMLDSFVQTNTAMEASLLFRGRSLQLGHLNYSDIGNSWFSGVYPPRIKRGNWKSSRNGGFNRKITELNIYKQCIFHCRVWFLLRVLRWFSRFPYFNVHLGTSAFPISLEVSWVNPVTIGGFLWLWPSAGPRTWRSPASASQCPLGPGK